MRILPQTPFSVESFIFNAVDILRDRVAVHDYHVVSLLLFLQKEGIIKDLTKLQPHDAKKELFRSVGKLSVIEKSQFRFSNRTQQVNAIFDAFQPTVNKLDDRTLHRLLKLIESVGENNLDLYLGEIIEALIYSVSKSEGRFGGEYVQPIELSLFISALAAGLPGGATVYNPFAGIASFGVYLNKDYHYSGQEINHLTWAIGMLRLFAHNWEGSSDFVIGDSINNWNPWFERYDLIVANPPFGYMVPASHGSKVTVPCDVFVIEKSLHSLKENGKAIFVIPDIFLSGSRKIYQVLRKELVNSDLLEMVISFPGGLLTNTGISFSVIVINKAKKQKGFTLFVDAEPSIKQVSKRIKQIDPEHLLNIIRSSNHSDAKLVPQEEIIKNDFLLSVNRYLIEDLPEIIGVPLRNIADLVRGTRVGGNVFGKFVRIRDLKSDKQDFNLDTDALEEMEIPKNAIKLERSALLLTVRWRTLKPTYFEYKGEPIYIFPDILALQVNEEKVDLGYLVQELYADYVAIQLNRYRTGSIVPYISKEDLLKILIELPPLRDQRAKITGSSLRAIETERAEIKKQAYEEFASIKHSMGKPLLNIYSGVKNIETALSKLDQNWEEIKLSQKVDYTMRDAINSLFANLNLLSNLLKNNERELDVASYPLGQVNAIQFFMKYIHDLKATDGEKFEVTFDIAPDLEREFEGDVYIKANEELLKIALNNIVDNAQRHGFTEDRKDYKIEFRLSLYETKANPYLMIEVANNGTPFPMNFTLEKLVRKAAIAGSTGNSGIGGHDIYEIVKWHGGRFDINTDPYLTLPFTTVYEIYIPINASNGNNE